MEDELIKEVTGVDIHIVTEDNKESILRYGFKNANSEIELSKLSIDNYLNFNKKTIEFLFKTNCDSCNFAVISKNKRIDNEKMNIRDLFKTIKSTLDNINESCKIKI